MKIFIISDRNHDDEYYKYYSNYALPEDIEIIDYKTAKLDLEIRLFQKQEHVDVLIFDIDQEVDYDFDDNLFKWIRTCSSELTYSSFNFRFNNIPIAIINKNYLYLRNGELQDDCLNKIVIHLRNEPISTYNTVLSIIIDKWLDDLASDLDSLNLDLKFAFSENHLNDHSSKIVDCKVLSMQFFNRKKPLNYNWIGDKANVLERGADAMSHLVKKYETNSTYRDEKGIHTVLNNNQGFLLGEKFVKSYYEKHLYYSFSRSYIEVDFVNVSHEYFGQVYELNEVKLPSVRFISRKGLLLSNTKKHLNQIGIRYKNYFEDRTYQESNKLLFDTHTNNFNLTLLMGRKKDIEENRYLINQTLNEYEKEIKIVTYDDLIDKYNFLFQRIRRFNIS